MDENEIVLLICHPDLALEMMGELSPEAMVITPLVDRNTAILVPKDDFIDWLEEKGEYGRKEED